MTTRILNKQYLEQNPDLVDFGLEPGDSVNIHQEEFGLEVTFDKEVYYIHNLFENE